MATKNTNEGQHGSTTTEFKKERKPRTKQSREDAAAKKVAKLGVGELTRFPEKLIAMDFGVAEFLHAKFNEAMAAHKASQKD